MDVYRAALDDAKLQNFSSQELLKHILLYLSCICSFLMILELLISQKIPRHVLSIICSLEISVLIDVHVLMLYF